MPLNFDPVLKDDFIRYVEHFVEFLGLPKGLAIEAKNVDLSRVTAATDVVLAFGKPMTEITDVNFQAGPDIAIDKRILLYNALLRHQYDVPVRSILLLMRPAADYKIQGSVLDTCGETRLQFHYEVIRMWEQSVDTFLHGGLGLLPFATLCRMPDDVPLEMALHEVIMEIDQRLVAEALHEEAQRLMSSTFFLTGMRVEANELDPLFQGVKVMHNSTAYDHYVGIGEARGEARGKTLGETSRCHAVLLRQGRKRFGEPDSATVDALNSITDLERLDRLTDAILSVNSWAELLATP